MVIHAEWLGERHPRGVALHGIHPALRPRLDASDLLSLLFYRLSSRRIHGSCGSRRFARADLAPRSPQGFPAAF